MQNDWVTITLPMNAQALGTLSLVSGVFMLSWLTYLTSRRDYEEDLPKRLLNKLGLSNLHPVA